jgi:hypothetical protein
MKSNTEIPNPTRMIIMAIDKVKVRKHFSLIEKMFEDKKAYNRRYNKRVCHE